MSSYEISAEVEHVDDEALARLLGELEAALAIRGSDTFVIASRRVNGQRVDLRFSVTADDSREAFRVAEDALRFVVGTAAVGVGPRLEQV